MIHVPDTTTVWPTKPEHDNYVLFFAPELIEFIRQKQKYTTYRLGDRYDYLQPGDKVQIRQNHETRPIADAIITAKRWSTFHDLPIEVDGHEIYKDREQARQVLSGYYQFLGRKIEDNDLFLVLDFRLLDSLSS